jgi:Flp pilus assembly protein TadD
VGDATDVLDAAERALADGDLAAARALARECVGIDPANIECHHVLGFSFSRRGEYGAELRQEIVDCLAVDPADRHCLELEVASQLRSRDLAGARRTLAQRQALPDAPPDFLDEAELALAENDPQAACGAFRDACRLGQPYACRMVGKTCGGPRGESAP